MRIIRGQDPRTVKLLAIIAAFTIASWFNLYLIRCNVEDLFYLLRDLRAAIMAYLPTAPVAPLAPTPPTAPTPVPFVPVDIPLPTAPDPISDPLPDCPA